LYEELVRLRETLAIQALFTQLNEGDISVEEAEFLTKCMNKLIGYAFPENINVDEPREFVLHKDSDLSVLFESEVEDDA
jgi:hypothetical protein